jgi:hypothetical protein
VTTARTVPLTTDTSGEDLDHNASTTATEPTEAAG